MSRQSELAQLGRVFDNSALSNRNLIINGAMQVWQRGTSFNGSGYTADRWFQASNNTNAITQNSVTLPNGDAANTLKVTATGSVSEWFDIYQVVEDYKRLLGKTVTMSGWVRTNINGVVFRKYSDQNLSSVVPNDGAWHYIEATFTPDVSGGAVRGPTGSTFGVTFNAPLSVVSGDYYEFAQVQLELGDTATPFEHRPYGQELALCQRYYQQYLQKYRNAVYFSLANFFVFDRQELSQTMRASPTCTWKSGSIYLAINGQNTASSTMYAGSSSYGFSGATITGATFVINRQAGGVTPSNCLVYNTEVTDAIFAFDAEL